MRIFNSGVVFEGTIEKVVKPPVAPEDVCVVISGRGPRGGSDKTSVYLSIGEVARIYEGTLHTVSDRIEGAYNYSPPPAAYRDYTLDPLLVRELREATSPTRAASHESAIGQLVTKQAELVKQIAARRDALAAITASHQRAVDELTAQVSEVCRQIDLTLSSLDPQWEEDL